MKTLIEILERTSEQIASVLPEHVPLSRFLTTARRAIKSTPKIDQCDPSSVLGAILNAAEDGLLLDGDSGAMLVPRKTKGQLVCTYLPRRRALVELIWRTGRVRGLVNEVVRDGEQIDYYVDEHGQHLTHRPDLFGGGGAGEVIGSYAIVDLVGGGRIIEVVGPDDLRAVRGFSQSPAWGDHPGEMAKWVAVGRIAKRVGKSGDRVAAFDAPAFAPSDSDTAPADIPDRPTAASTLDAVSGDDEKSNLVSRLRALIKHAGYDRISEFLAVNGYRDIRRLDQLDEEELVGLIRVAERPAADDDSDGPVSHDDEEDVL